MKTAALLAVAASLSTPCFAQPAPSGALAVANCQVAAGPGAPPSDALQIVGGQDVDLRSLFGVHDHVVIGGGSAQGLTVGQRFFIRRAVDWGTRKSVGLVHAVDTAGGLHITAVNDTTALAVIDFMCDGIMSTDFLVPYKEPALDPPSAAATGEPDFAVVGRVVAGPSDHQTAGAGEFVIGDIGESKGATPGARFAVYRDMDSRGLPLQAIGEAIVVSAEPDTSIVRLTTTRDAIRSGDLLVLRH